VIHDPLRAVRAGAVSAAIDGALRLHPVAHNPNVAVSTAGRQLLDGAFEGIEDVPSICHPHLEGRMVVVSARFAYRHRYLPGGVSGSAGPQGPASDPAGSALTAPSDSDHAHEACDFMVPPAGNRSCQGSTQVRVSWRNRTLTRVGNGRPPLRGGKRRGAGRPALPSPVTPERDDGVLRVTGVEQAGSVPGWALRRDSGPDPGAPQLSTVRRPKQCPGGDGAPDAPPPARFRGYPSRRFPG